MAALRWRLYRTWLCGDWLRGRRSERRWQRALSAVRGGRGHAQTAESKGEMRAQEGGGRRASARPFKQTEASGERAQHGGATRREQCNTRPAVQCTVSALFNNFKFPILPQTYH